MNKPSDQKQEDLLAPSQESVYTVSELTGQVRALLEGQFAYVRVVGEVSGLSVASSGHVYFSLKDERASLAAVLFKSSASRLGEIPEEGDQVECLGRLTMYEPRGRTQLIVEYLVERGEGALGLMFQKLKSKLAKEGLFDQARKRALPFVPNCIGVVTSPTGAAIRDILKVLDRRFPAVEVLLYPVRVQGAGAAEEIACAIDRLGDGKDCDVLIVGRGGGSAEDLWAFNSEIVVRAIVASKVPVISAVGHEVDIVLSDLAADLRAATPSVAAEIVVPNQALLREQFGERIEGLATTIILRLTRARRQMAELARRIGDPRLVLAAHRMRLDETMQAGTALLNRRLRISRRGFTDLRIALAAHDPRPLMQNARVRLESASKRLAREMSAGLQARLSLVEARRASLAELDPQSVLARGYSIVSRADGTILRDSSKVAPDDDIHVRLQYGQLDATVKKTGQK
ncbi:MAG: exodeoxyribonuclease VII large subunit [Deltaproteobacteria bacterium]|nr:exodeoxyribonuclease VII large subunit [Deltaproteobacteria bacterium]MBW1871598.1 exodeoxyribonuclease VII large subunit [Deltaproteobacteria bacterium]